MQRVNESIYALLRQWLPEEVDIYPGVASEDAQCPYVVFNPDSFQTKRTKDGIYQYIFQYSVDVWGCTFNMADKYASQVLEAADQADLTDWELTMVALDGVAEYTDGFFLQHLVFEVKTKGGAA